MRKEIFLFSLVLLIGFIGVVGAAQYTCSQDSDCKVDVCSTICVNESFSIPEGVGCAYPANMIPKECKCVNNICVSVSSNETRTCTDSDGGLNYYTKGTISGISFYTNEEVGVDDVCTLNGGLIGSCAKGDNCNVAEYYCENDYVKVEDYNCPNGCEDGACIQGGETIPEKIDAYLNQKFELKSQQTAIIKDYKNMRLKYVAMMTPMCACPAEGPCPPCKPGITLQAEMPPDEDEATGEGTEFTIRVGEKKEVFGVTISLIDLNNGVAVLLVTKQDCPEGCICTDETISCPACQEGYSWNPKTKKCEPLVYTCPEGCICTNITISCPGNVTRSKGFRYAYFECYDGTTSKSINRSACKTAGFWKKFASNFCESHCKKYKDVEKCGVNTFSVWDECYLEETGEGSTEGETPIEIEEGEIEAELMCKNSCPLDKKCYPFGYRKGGEYCSDEGGFIEQLKAEKTCDNNFECESNVCVDGKCISGGLIQRILNWFRRLFGRG